MKKILFITYIMLSAVVFGFAQTATTVYTCKGGSVNANLFPAGTPSQKAVWRQEFLNWGASRGLGENDILAEASGAYNCHAYAWHLREGNTNQVWIANATLLPPPACQPETHNIDKYWTDGCFIKVCNEADADKTHYYCGDHSAVTSTVVAGKFESKWGSWPVIRHNPTTVPYEQPTTVNYYASTKISGDVSNLCTGNRTFTVKNISGATYTWTYSGSVLAVGATNTNQLTVQINGSSAGAAWVQVQISTPCSASSVTSRIDFFVGAAVSGYYRIHSDYHNYGIFYPLYNNNSPIWLPANKGFGVDVWLNSPGIQSAVWSRATTSYLFNWNTSGTFLSFAGTSGASAYVERKGIFNITAQTTCGTFNGTYNWPVIVQGWGSFQITTSPNPATDLITLNISEESPEVKDLGKEGDVIIEIYTLNQSRLIKQWKYKNDQNRFGLNVANLPKGNYIIVVKKGTFKESKHVLIEK